MYIIINIFDSSLSTKKTFFSFSTLTPSPSDSSEWKANEKLRNEVQRLEGVSKVQNYPLYKSNSQLE